MKNRWLKFFAGFLDKGIPLASNIIFWFLIWGKLIPEELRMMIQQSISPFGEVLLSVPYFGSLGMSDYFFAIFKWLLLWGTIIGLFILGYVFFKRIWREAGQFLGLIKTEKTTHVAKVLKQHSQKHTSTTYINVNNALLPVSSDYTDYFLEISLGNKESVQMEIEVDSSTYHYVEVGNSYKATVTVEKVFGIHIDDHLTIDSSYSL